jgi:hypothetical protein
MTDYHSLNNVVLAQMCFVVIISGFVIFNYLKFASLRTRSFELVFFLVICDLLSNVAYAINPRSPSTQPHEESTSPLCTFQGMSIQFFSLAAVSWNTTIALTLYRFVVLNKTTFSIMKCHMVIWPMCAISAILPLVPKNTYGEVIDSSWCWIKNDRQGESEIALIYQYLCFYVPCGLSVLFSLVSYARVYHTVQRFLSIGGAARLLRLIRTFKYFPAIFVLSWIPQICVYLLEAQQSSDTENSTLATLNVVARGSFLMAIGNSLLFGMNDSVKKEWRLLFGRIKEYTCCTATKTLFKVNMTNLRDTTNDFDFEGNGDPGFDPRCRRVESAWSESNESRFSDGVRYTNDEATRQSLRTASICTSIEQPNCIEMNASTKKLPIASAVEIA